MWFTGRDSTTSNYAIGYTVLIGPVPVPPDTVAPSVPTSVLASASSTSKINLSWASSTDAVGVVGYKIFRNEVQVATTSILSYQDFGLSSSTSYSYTIAAYDVAGNTSLPSESVSATTNAPPPISTAYISWSDIGVGYTAPTGDAYYPSTLYDASGFGVGTSTYRMWYSDGVGALFLTTSTDGVIWRTPTTTVGLTNVHHAQVLYNASCFGVSPCTATSTKYRVWFWDMGAPTIYSISSIATAESIDGIHWINKSTVTQNSGAKLIQDPDSGTGWNRGTYGPVSLTYQPSAINNGTEPWNYKYIMYYDGTDGGHEDTGLAYSSDGLNWSAYTVNPVLQSSHVGGSEAWDCYSAVYGSVIKDSSGYHFFYSGKGQDDGSGGCAYITDFNGIGYASSVDGKVWIKDANPIFQTSDGVSYRSGRIYTPSVINDGSGFLRMYFSAKGGSGVKKIGYATLVAPSVPVPVPAGPATLIGGTGGEVSSVPIVPIQNKQIVPAVPIAVLETENTPSKTDLNNDGSITINDLSIFLFRWESEDATLKQSIDFNNDGKVDVSDFSILLNVIRIQ
ncbi:MAG: dockerin type I domain-containing protein [Candidatus Paceibacterota bacterium]|jgi:hypothetical protein